MESELSPPHDVVVRGVFDALSSPCRTIHQLPAAVVARIAAGEVVERPASVVKELVENALDAGARNIRIDVHGGGLDLIRVGDDGSGIPADELWLACQRHATSKLVDADLTQVRTLGFRGEALPSIATVAELTLVSATDDFGVGQKVTLRDGHLIVDEPAPRTRGTTATVRQLFQSVPARLAAAGRVQTEITQIGQTARRLALAVPDVRLALNVDDRLVLQTSGSGDLTTTLVELYGPAVAGSVLPVGPVEAAGARVWGVICGPEITRPGRGQVNVIVNGRWAQPRGLLAMIEAAYRPLLPRGRHPVLALVLETACDQVDINIHPSKLEVRLRAERAIGNAVGDALRAALGKRALPLQAPFATGLAALTPSRTLAEGPTPYDDEEPIVTPGLPPLKLLGQVHGRLLLLEGPAGLYGIDQHRAHERILYEQLTVSHGQFGPDPVPLPEPLLLELRPAQMARLGRRLDDLAQLGFALEIFGGKSFLLRSVPILTGVAGPPDDALAGLGERGELVDALVALADDDLIEAKGEGWQERLLVNLSCRSAIRRGLTLDRAAMRALVEGLGNSSAPAVCPHGSPLLMHISGDMLERQFGWR